MDNIPLWGSSYLSHVVENYVKLLYENIYKTNNNFVESLQNLFHIFISMAKETEDLSYQFSDWTHFMLILPLHKISMTEDPIFCLEIYLGINLDSEKMINANLIFCIIIIIRF